MNDVNNRIFYEFSEFLKETESVPPEMRVSLAYEITIKSTIASALIDLASDLPAKTSWTNAIGTICGCSGISWIFCMLCGWTIIAPW